MDQPGQGRCLPTPWWSTAAKAGMAALEWTLAGVVWESLFGALVGGAESVRAWASTIALAGTNARRGVESTEAQKSLGLCWLCRPDEWQLSNIVLGGRRGFSNHSHGEETH